MCILQCGVEILSEHIYDATPLVQLIYYFLSDLSALTLTTAFPLLFFVLSTRDDAHCLALGFWMIFKNKQSTKAGEMDFELFSEEDLSDCLDF